LSQQQGRRPAVLIIAALLAAATAAFAGWAATLIVPLMQPAARVFLCALALGFAGGESLVLRPRVAKGEPTHSLGAFSFVLLAHQLTDAARFVIFGIAVATNAPVTVAAGGALGGMVLLGFGWAFPQIVLHGRIRVARRLIGVGFLLLAAYVAMRALDWI
ncbi:MAG: hypothetical protein KUG65_02165, partial [Sphingomonadaceae bacterium]|nr:hypothetical protein [Sphingomonadaceae bacterium]